MNKALENLQHNLDTYAGYETPYGQEGIIYEAVKKNDDIEVYRYTFTFGELVTRKQVKRENKPKRVFTIYDYGQVDFNPDYNIQAPVIKIINDYLNEAHKYWDYSKFLKKPMIDLEVGLNWSEHEIEQMPDGVWRYKNLRRNSNVANMTINLAELPKDIADNLNGEVRVPNFAGQKFYIFGVKFYPDGTCQLLLREKDD